MTPNDIQNKRFDKGMGGYKTDDVNTYLAEVAAYMQELQDERDDMEKKMLVLAEKVEEYREDEDSLRAALIGAQKLGDTVVRDARKKAELLLAEASMKAEELVADAKSNIDREAVSLTRIQGEVAEFKNQLLSLYKRHIEMIQEIPNENEVQIPVVATAGKRSLQSGEKAGNQDATPLQEFRLNYTRDDQSEQESTEDVAETSAGKHKRNYGKLHFGEEYNLTRKD